MVLRPEKEAQAEAIFRKWGLDFAVVGETTPSRRFIVRHRDAIKADLPIKELGDEAPVYERPFVDPPRQGLEPEVAQALATTQPPRIYYISCDPATLTRDLKILLPAGYALREARLFDMFPRTAHFETAVRLERI